MAIMMTLDRSAIQAVMPMLSSLALEAKRARLGVRPQIMPMARRRKLPCKSVMRLR